MYTPKFLKSSIQILHTSHKNYLVRKYTRNWSFRNHYHSQPHISPSHLISTSLFIILQRVRRQNVVIKSDIFTTFKGLSFFLFVLRVENKIVRGFRWSKCVKMSLFITTFCRLTRCRMMNMTSKSDATAICVVESDNEYENSKSGCIQLSYGYYEACAKLDEV